MAIKHVVTGGYGFADGTIYLPTRGYTPAVVTADPIATLRLPARYEPTLQIAAVYSPIVDAPATCETTIDLPAGV